MNLITIAKVFINKYRNKKNINNKKKLNLVQIVKAPN
jgi:hypothetical protein